MRPHPAFALNWGGGANLYSRFSFEGRVPFTVRARQRRCWKSFNPGRPLIYVRSTEEGRVTDLLREAGRQLRPSAPLPVWTWSLTEGLSREDGTEAATADVLDPREALDFIAAHTEPAIFHLKDFHEPLRDSAGVRRRLRDLYRICLDKQKFIVITSPLRSIPEEVERSFVVIDLPPPDLL